MSSSDSSIDEDSQSQHAQRTSFMERRLQRISSFKSEIPHLEDDSDDSSIEEEEERMNHPVSVAAAVGSLKKESDRHSLDYSDDNRCQPELQSTARVSSAAQCPLSPIPSDLQIESTNRCQIIDLSPSSQDPSSQRNETIRHLSKPSLLIASDQFSSMNTPLQKLNNLNQIHRSIEAEKKIESSSDKKVIPSTLPKDSRVNNQYGLGTRSGSIDKKNSCQIEYDLGRRTSKDMITSTQTQQSSSTKLSSFDENRRPPTPTESTQMHKQSFRILELEERGRQLRNENEQWKQKCELIQKQKEAEEAYSCELLLKTEKLLTSYSQLKASNSKLKDDLADLKENNRLLAEQLFESQKQNYKLIEEATALKQLNQAKQFNEEEEQNLRAFVQKQDEIIQKLSEEVVAKKNNSGSSSMPSFLQQLKKILSQSEEANRNTESDAFDEQNPDSLLIKVDRMKTDCVKYKEFARSFKENVRRIGGQALSSNPTLRECQRYFTKIYEEYISMRIPVEESKASWDLLRKILNVQSDREIISKVESLMIQARNKSGAHLDQHYIRRSSPNIYENHVNQQTGFYSNPSSQTTNNNLFQKQQQSPHQRINSHEYAPPPHQQFPSAGSIASHQQYGSTYLKTN